MSVPLPLEKQRKGRGFRGEEEPVVEETENWETLDQAEGEGAIGGGWKRSIEGWIVILTNINEETTEEDIHDKFGEFGKINNLHLNLDRRTGFVKGYALLEYATYKEAKTAVATANDTEFLGNKIKVDFAFVKGTSGKENKQRGNAKNSRR